MCRPTRCLAVMAFLVGSPQAHGSAESLEWLRLSDDGKGFVESESGRAFVPWGFNYDHEGDGRLLEEYWDEKWPTVESAFREMKELGANVVRIHLQFGAFMESPNKPRRAALKSTCSARSTGGRDGIVSGCHGVGLLPQAGRAALV